MLEELKQIRELLAAKPALATATPFGLWNEFKAFIENYEVMGLAMAFILVYILVNWFNLWLLT